MSIHHFVPKAMQNAIFISVFMHQLLMMNGSQQKKHSCSMKLHFSTKTVIKARKINLGGLNSNVAFKCI